MSNEEIQGQIRPGLLSFIYGMPDPEAFPIEPLIASTEEALRKRGRVALQYGPTRGYRALLDYLIEKFRREEGLSLSRENLLISAGASQALEMVCCLFARPGDTVLVEAPTYHETLMILRDFRLCLRQIPLDGEGLRVDILRQKLGRLRAEGMRPSFIYVIPDFQNPSGLTMSLARREELIRLAHEFETLIVEDDVYRELCYEGEVPPSLYALDERAGGSHVIRLGSFSKIIAAGLRLGWVMAAPVHIERFMNSGLAAAAGGANPFVSHVVATFCHRGLLEPHIIALVERYRAKRDVMLAALAEFMPEGVSWTHPSGGFFVWLTLPPELEAQALLKEAEEHGITYLPGPHFFAEGGGEHNIRLPFSFLPPERIEQGVEILAKVISCHLR